MDRNEYCAKMNEIYRMKMDVQSDYAYYLHAQGVKREEIARKLDCSDARVDILIGHYVNRNKK